MLNVIKNRYVYFLVSWIFIFISLFAFFFKDLNLWIDMTWWTQSEYTYTWDINISILDNEIRNLATAFNQKNNNNVINNTSIYKVSWEDKFVITVWYSTNFEDKDLEAYKIDYRDSITDYLIKNNYNIKLTKYINIWKSFWDYIKQTAKITLIIAIVAISFYIAFAFFGAVSWINSFSFALITIITLFHDVVISSGLYIFAWTVFSEFQIDTFFVTALLTILGYSINDTIVVFDRIRSNLKQFWWKTKNLKEIINLSVNETLTRSIYTSLTILIVLVWIFFFWPETVRWFVMVMIFGTIVWTYSSIFIASPMLFELNKNKIIKAYEKKEVKPEDKIVV